MRIGTDEEGLLEPGEALLRLVDAGRARTDDTFALRRIGPSADDRSFGLRTLWACSEFGVVGLRMTRLVARGRWRGITPACRSGGRRSRRAAPSRRSGDRRAGRGWAAGA